MDTKKTTRESKDTVRLFIIGVIMSFVVIGVWWANGFILMNFVDEQNRGTYGDMFGAVSALFSGLAFVGIIITILLQWQELGFQRAELAHTREEIRGQKQQMELQNLTLKKQNFENTFFAMLTLFGEIVSSTEIDNNITKITRGRPCFVLLMGRLYGPYDSNFNNLDRKKEFELIEYFHSENQSYLTHYFYYLKSILKFIDSSTIDNKSFYIDLVRSQLSNHELILIFYYSFFIEKAELQGLIKKYSLFKEFPFYLLLNQEEHSKLLEL